MDALEKWYRRRTVDIEANRVELRQRARCAFEAKTRRHAHDDKFRASTGTADQLKSEYEQEARRASARRPVTVSAHRGALPVRPTKRADINNPGLVFETLEEAASASLRMINPTSVSENKEYMYAYVRDENTGYYGFTDPYETGLKGHEKIVLRPTVNGQKISDFSYAGMSHTHGDYSDTNGRRAPRARDAFSSDKFSSDRDGDMAFMKSNKIFPYFTLGTPSGNFLQYTTGDDKPRPFVGREEDFDPSNLDEWK